jgi:MFS family permease
VPHRRRDAIAHGTGILSVLKNHHFLGLWLAQVLSQTAQNCLWFSLVIMVSDATRRNPAGIGFTIILVQLPTMLFSGVSGVLVDRVSKRMILVGTNVIRVAGVLLYLVSQQHVYGLYLITFLVAVISQPFAPAEGATIPLVVSREQLITANSLFQMTFMAAQAVGFALAPIAIEVFGIPTTLILLAALFALAALALISLPDSTRQHPVNERVSTAVLARRVRDDLREVFHFIRDEPPLAVALFQIALPPTLLLVLAEVGPDFVSNTLGLGQTSTALFFLLAPAGAGLGLGILILAQWGSRLRKDRLVLVSLIALGVTVIGLAAVPLEASFWNRLHALGLPIPAGVGFTVSMFPITVLAGIEVAFINAPAQTIIQESATAGIRGRVIAMQQTLSAALAIPPLIVVALAAAALGTPATLTLTGLVLVAIGLGIVYYS